MRGVGLGFRVEGWLCRPLTNKPPPLNRIIAGILIGSSMEGFINQGSTLVSCELRTEVRWGRGRTYKGKYRGLGGRHNFQSGAHVGYIRGR